MGRPKLCNPCCDGGAGGSSSSSSSSRYSGSTVSGCTQCIDLVLPAQLTVAFSGITAGTCSAGYCEGANRTWTLTKSATPSSCSYGENFTTGDSCFSSNVIQCTVQFQSTKIVCFLALNSNSFFTYEKAITGPYDCLTAHVLTLQNNTGRCGNPPATVTVAPA